MDTLLSESLADKCREELSEFMKNYKRNLHTLDTSKYSLFPVEYPELYAFYERQRDMFWVTQEIEFGQDRYSWDSLHKKERKFLLFVLFFFSQADGIVMENISTNFQEEVPFKEAKAFYAMQNAIEAVHAETYATMIETVVRDERMKEKAFNAIQHCPEIATMAAWVTFWMDRKHDLVVRIFAFAIYEGVFFNIGFVPIRWLGGGDKNKMPGFCQANELISKDEALHTVGALYILDALGFCGNPKYADVVELIIQSSFEVIRELIVRALKIHLIGMTAEMMIEFTKVVYNKITKKIGFGKFFPGAKNPFQFMAEIGMANKTNFFEHKVTAYRKVQPGNESYEYRILEEGTY